MDTVHSGPNFRTVIALDEHAYAARADGDEHSDGWVYWMLLSTSRREV